MGWLESLAEILCNPARASLGYELGYENPYVEGYLEHEAYNFAIENWREICDLF